MCIRDRQDVDRLQSEIEFFDPELKVSALPSFDVSPYSGLYPNTKIISARVRWLSEASRPQSVSYTHLTLPPSDLV